MQRVRPPAAPMVDRRARVASLPSAVLPAPPAPPAPPPTASWPRPAPTPWRIVPRRRRCPRRSTTPAHRTRSQHPEPVAAPAAREPGGLLLGAVVEQLREQQPSLELSEVVL